MMNLKGIILLVWKILLNHCIKELQKYYWNLVYLVEELVLVFYAPLWLGWCIMVVLLMFFCMVIVLVIVLWEVNAILGNGCEIQRQNYVAWLQGSEMPVGFHYRNLILGV